MADTSSIASRMEKLAQLKRMKLERAAAKGEPESTSTHVDSLTEASPETTCETHEKAAIATSYERDDLELQAPSVEVPVSETPILDVPAAEFLTDDLPELGTQSVGNALTAESEAVESFVELPSDIADAASSVDAYDDGPQNTAILATELETDDLFDVNEQDLDTELPADLLDLEETSEAYETAEFTTTGSVKFNESVSIGSAQAEVTATENVSETDAGHETLSEEALDDDYLQMDKLDDNAPIADIEQLNESAEKIEIPDFAENEIDPAVLEREFEHETEETTAVPTATLAEDGLITLTFDNSRSTLLNHVSRKMDCSPEDVVVTALDWYLDALFGEESDEAQSA